MRFILSVLILLVAASLQTAGATLLARPNLSVDLLLVCVVCCALLMGEASLLATAAFAGLLKDCFSAGYFGHSVAVFVPIALLIVFVKRLLWVTHWTTQAGLAFAATLAAWLLYGLLQSFWRQPLDPGGSFFLKEALLNACAAPFIFMIWKAALQK